MFLFSQYKSRDNILRNSFFQISSYLREHLRIHCEKTAEQVPLEPLLGKQNIQAKEVYCAMLQTYNEIDVTRFSYAFRLSIIAPVKKSVNKIREL